MEFLNPGLLWGALAVSIPVILHFWHQKRGKELPWAASRWLSGPVLQKSRGMRLENILLLILRCLLLLLLVLYLSEPLIRQFSGKQEKVHWVQPDREVVENFRFELEEAGKRGEKRFWFNGEPVTDLAVLPGDPLTDLQVGINTVNTGGTAEIYLTDTDNFTRFPRVYLPVPYTLHLTKSRLREPDSGERAFVLPAGERGRTDPLKVLTEEVPAEKETISAALKAITGVYGLYFEIDEKRIPGLRYDLVFSHKPDSSAVVNVVSGAKTLAGARITDREIRFEELLKPETSEVVFDGELPEIILEALIAANGRPSRQLSRRQLQEKFAIRQPDRAESSFHSVILVLFILVLGAERWLALHKNS
ncbi:MAG: BatA domain-containing protein [Leadbetterella sp.]|nr:BatA domain-containing protein [Leadbetterella sp.]